MITPFASPRRAPRAFTLIELLVVISILAILMTLLFPAVQGALDQAKKTQAKNDATQIATAISAYMTEYGRVPSTAGGDVTDANGDDLLDALMPPSGTPSDLNPRGLVFLEIPTTKAAGQKSGRVEGAGPYLDPWGNAYLISLDGNYDNTISGPDGDVRKTVLVWSQGNPAKRNDFTNPKKWVKSWE